MVTALICPLIVRRMQACLYMCTTYTHNRYTRHSQDTHSPHTHTHTHRADTHTHKQITYTHTHSKYTHATYTYMPDIYTLHVCITDTTYMADVLLFLISMEIY